MVFTPTPVGNKQSSAFTLVELTVVLALFVMLAVSVALILRRPYQAARLQNAIERIEAIDQIARNHARKFQRLSTLKFQLGSPQVTIEFEAKDKKNVRKMHLGRSVEVADFTTTATIPSGRQRTVSIDRQGCSETYACQLKDRGGASQWILFTGGVGQPIRLQEKQSIDQIIKTLRTRNHAD